MENPIREEIINLWGEDFFNACVADAIQIRLESFNKSCPGKKIEEYFGSNWDQLEAIGPYLVMACAVKKLRDRC